VLKIQRLIHQLNPGTVRHKKSSVSFNRSNGDGGGHPSAGRGPPRLIPVAWFKAGNAELAHLREKIIFFAKLPLILT
jgi:hypothetical protein